MSSGIEIVGIDRLRPHLDKAKVLEAVRGALILQAAGQVQSPPPGQLLFKKPHGDCHIKFGHVADAPTFAIKIATGFYDNPMLGLPVNYGLILIMDAATGAPLVILKDDGWLTAWRTAAAVALMAQAFAPAAITGIGIFGTGLQARLAVEWIVALLGPYPVFVCGRAINRTQDFVASLSGIGATAVDSADTLLSQCNLVITATPSENALFAAASVRAGTHIVAVGADSPGKQELPAALFARAACIIVDDLAQSLDHGDFGIAVRQGVVAADRAIMAGDLLSGTRVYHRKDSDITIADLTGIAAEDMAIAGCFYHALKQC